MLQPNIRYLLGRLARQTVFVPQAEAEILVSTGQAEWLEVQAPQDNSAPSTEAPAESDYPIHKGRGIYELSNGEKVKGKAAALAAEAEL